MRLLNTSTLQLVEFVRDIPPYAILSHTWGPEEVTFQDLQDPSGMVRETAGFSKIQKSCELARNFYYEYIWIDTCCINKESSAELSEAINSMYPYYRGSRVCYVYMSDVQNDEDLRNTAFLPAFRNSRWFTRGWTLQELLAPSNVVFLDRNWNDIGTKSSLANVLTVLTGIPYQILLGDLSVNVSIAARMSWAAKRQTTRPEDIAYCLMGIFDVNMPTLYGEGAQRAFMRLQEEIIKYSDDQSIFAWRVQARPSASQEFDISDARGLFASSPAEFMDSGKLSISSNRDVGAFPYTMTNLGLHIHLPVISVDPRNRVYLAVLNCNLRGRAVGIYLHRKYPLGLQFFRVKPDDVALEHDWAIPDQKQEIYVRQRNAVGTLDQFNGQEMSNHCELEIRSLPSLQGFGLVKTLADFDPWSGDFSPARTVEDDVASLDVGQCVLLHFRGSIMEEKFLVVIGRGSKDEGDTESTLSCKIVVNFSDDLRRPLGRPGGRPVRLIARNFEERNLQMLRRNEYISCVIHRTGCRNRYIAEIALITSVQKSSPIVPSPPGEFGFEIGFLQSTFSLEGFTLDFGKHRSYDEENQVLYISRMRQGIIKVRDDTNTAILGIVLGMGLTGAWVDMWVYADEEVTEKAIWNSDYALAHGPRRSSASVRGYEVTIKVEEVNSLSSHATHVLNAALLKSS